MRSAAQPGIARPGGSPRPGAASWTTPSGGRRRSVRVMEPLEQPRRLDPVVDAHAVVDRADVELHRVGRDEERLARSPGWSGRPRAARAPRPGAGSSPCGSRGPFEPAPARSPGSSSAPPPPRRGSRTTSSTWLEVGTTALTPVSTTACARSQSTSSGEHDDAGGRADRVPQRVEHHARLVVHAPIAGSTTTMPGRQRRSFSSTRGQRRCTSRRRGGRARRTTGRALRRSAAPAARPRASRRARPLRDRPPRPPRACRRLCAAPGLGEAPRRYSPLVSVLTRTNSPHPQRDDVERVDALALQPAQQVVVMRGHPVEREARRMRRT